MVTVVMYPYKEINSISTIIDAYGHYDTGGDGNTSEWQHGIGMKWSKIKKAIQDTSISYSNTSYRVSLGGLPDMPDDIKRRLVDGGIKLPKKSDMWNILLNKEQVYDLMLKMGNKGITTSDIAVFITPKANKKKDPIGHHKWDIALSHIRQQIRKLAAEGKIKIKLDKSSKRKTYVYQVIK